MYQLILVRHAETTANTETRWQGQRQDGVLTAWGERQIQRVAQRLEAERDPIVALYTSPLGRALRTAQGIGTATGLTPVVEDDLQEMDFGDLDSWTMAEIAEKHPDFVEAWRDAHDADLTWPGGERRRDFWQRVSGVFDRIIRLYPEGTVAIVSHGGSLRVAIGHLLGWPPHISLSYNLDNCSLTRLVYEYERWRLLTLNDVCHLEGGE